MNEERYCIYAMCFNRYIYDREARREIDLDEIVHILNTYEKMKKEKN